MLSSLFDNNKNTTQKSHKMCQDIIYTTGVDRPSTPVWSKKKRKGERSKLPAHRQFIISHKYLDHLLLQPSIWELENNTRLINANYCYGENKKTKIKAGYDAKPVEALCKVRCRLDKCVAALFLLRRRSYCPAASTKGAVAV